MEITVRNLQKKLAIRPIKIKSQILKILKKEGPKSGWINVCFAGDPLIKKFNSKFLKKNNPTDVLAFNLNNKKEKNKIFADILISCDTAIRQAANFKTSPEYELLLYVTHGLLHILGYNDQTKAQMKIMRKKELEYVDR